jgi:hypothetical protein
MTGFKEFIIVEYDDGEIINNKRLDELRFEAYKLNLPS